MSKVAAVVVSCAPISLTVKSRKTIQTRYFIHGYFRRLWPATTLEKSSGHSPRTTFTDHAQWLFAGITGAKTQVLPFCSPGGCDVFAEQSQTIVSDSESYR